MLSQTWNTCKKGAISSWASLDKNSNKFVISYLAIMTITVILFVLPCSVVAKHGPHHPKSPVRSIHSTHHHHVPTKSESGETQKITVDRQLLQDKEHIREDMGEWMFADGKEPTPEEMEFHYFKMHDFDNNSQLDGLEIFQALSHVLPIDDANSVEHGQAESSEKNSQNYAVNYESNNPAKLTDEDLNYYIEMIDRVLEEDDLNKDGYLSYAEYVVGRRKMDEKELTLKRT